VCRIVDIHTFIFYLSLCRWPARSRLMQRREHKRIKQSFGCAGLGLETQITTLRGSFKRARTDWYVLAI
jgi:hypothetical protein